MIFTSSEIRGMLAFNNIKWGTKHKNHIRFLSDGSWVVRKHVFDSNSGNARIIVPNKTSLLLILVDKRPRVPLPYILIELKINKKKEKKQLSLPYELLFEQVYVTNNSGLIDAAKKAGIRVFKQYESRKHFKYDKHVEDMNFPGTDSKVFYNPLT